ncbi:MAG: hypothetical protein PHD70_14595 [Anaerostipes sp.]|nr:hypothetical protein [Anaerostipes sp.]MDD3747686.1 hypothetical protein [Anaerostipes sp.]
MEQMSMFGCSTAYRSSKITSKTRRESHGLLDKQKKNQMILNELQFGEYTARELADILHRKGLCKTTERNETAPRLSEMMEKGIVEVTGKRMDSVTGRMVAVYGIVEDEDE